MRAGDLVSVRYAWAQTPDGPQWRWSAETYRVVGFKYDGTTVVLEYVTGIFEGARECYARDNVRAIEATP